MSNQSRFHFKNGYDFIRSTTVMRTISFIFLKWYVFQEMLCVHYCDFKSLFFSINSTSSYFERLLERQFSFYIILLFLISIRSYGVFVLLCCRKEVGAFHFDTMSHYSQITSQFSFTGANISLSLFINVAWIPKLHMWARKSHIKPTI